MQYRSLLELNQLVRETLNTHLDPEYWVVAEIADLRLNQKGHCYLELVEKEEDKVIARCRATIWAYTYRSITARFESQTGQPLKNGMKILCLVNITYHELYGFSMNIREIDPRFTLGEREQRRRQIIERLKKEGVFSMNKMHELPIIPRRVAIISSESAAGYGDFMNQLHGNTYGYTYSTRLFNAIMQGEQAPGSIMNALNQIHTVEDAFDLVLILRGGGAQVDLDCFDSYDLSNHVAQFPLPVITGIGHDRDQTITDLVAHTAVKTPTAAAEFLINGIRNFEERVIESFERLVTLSNKRLQQADKRLADMDFGIKTAVRNRLHASEKMLQTLQNRLKTACTLTLQRQENRLLIAEKSLQLVNPANILLRGYTLTLHNGKAIDPKKLTEGDQIVTRSATHTINSTIKEIYRHD